MSRNGSGTYTLPAGNPVVTGTTISTTWANNTLNDIAATLTDSVAADGQTPMTGDLDLNSNKIVNLAAGTIAGDAVEYSQLTAATSVVTITGGTINGATIGATTPASGRFTTLEASSTLQAGGATTLSSTLNVTGVTTLSSTLNVTGVATFAANSQFNGTGALKIPVGTTAEQPTPTAGMLRYNNTTNLFEGYGSSWTSLGGGAAGSNTQVQYNNTGVLAGSSAFTFDGTVLTVPKITFASSNTPSLTNYQGGAVTSGTAVASTSGTSIDFTSIPSWVKKITVMFSGVSTNGTSPIIIQLGTSGGIVTSGYAGAVLLAASASTSAREAFTTGLGCDVTNAFTTSATVRYGKTEIFNITSNTWVSTTVNAFTGTNAGTFGGGSKNLGATLDRIRITTLNGTDTFDAGSINILYE